MALALVRKVIDTYQCLTVRDTAEMCDLKRNTIQCIFKMGGQTFEVFSVWCRKLKKKKKNRDLQKR